MGSRDTWPFTAVGDRLSLEKFVEAALFDPNRGYYGSRIKTVGAGGDFSTSATLSTLLGRAIAHWVISRPRLLPIIEVGAGDGSLARDISTAIPLLQRWRIPYHIVDTSDPLREKQRANAPRGTRWHLDLASALDACDGEALIFSNELVDAYPPRQFRRERDGWSELHLESTPDGIAEVWQPVSFDDLPPSTSLAPSTPPGHRVEVHDSYRQHLYNIAPHWISGEMLTIDYGDTADHIYHRRPHGSMRAYLLHELREGGEIYQNPGQQDLTCDVNFTDLIQWGNDHGWQPHPLQTQSEFLTPFAKGSTVDHYLLHPDGPGSAFKVLRQTCDSHKK